MTWYTKNISDFFIRLLKAWWDSTTYTWDDPVCTWDATSVDGENWYTKNNTTWQQPS